MFASIHSGTIVSSRKWCPYFQKQTWLQAWGCGPVIHQKYDGIRSSEGSIFSRQVQPCPYQAIPSLLLCRHTETSQKVIAVLCMLKSKFLGEEEKEGRKKKKEKEIMLPMKLQLVLD